jgi:hypothetical protein
MREVTMSQTTSPCSAERSEVHPGGPPPGGSPAPRRPILLIAALVVAVAVIAALVAVILWPDDSDDVTTEPATTTTEAPATTATTAFPTTTEAPPTVAPVDTTTAVFPYGTGDVRYFNPVEAARAFAVDFVGFTDPLIGEFMQGDARSGEVQVRPTANGPVTTVFVRQLGTDGSWWVLGSVTAYITADRPGQGEAINSPVTVSGSAMAFEGQVVVEVREDGAREPLGTGYVTGGGDEMRPFSGQVSFSPASADYGAMVFLSNSAENGEIWEATVYRVRFA